MKTINILGEINEDSSREILDQIFNITKENSETVTSNEYLVDDFKEELEPIIVNICSPGGSVHHGYAIIDALKDSGSRIITRGYGQVASMALDIFICGDTRLAGKNCRFLFHGTRGMAQGTSPDLREQLQEFDRMDEHMKGFYKEHDVKLPDEIFDNYIHSGLDYLFGYEEAKEYNIING